MKASAAWLNEKIWGENSISISYRMDSISDVALAGNEPDQTTSLTTTIPYNPVPYSFKGKENFETLPSRDDFYKDKVREFIRAAKGEVLEYGIYSHCDRLMARWHDVLGRDVGVLAGKIYIESCSNVAVGLALLKAISSLDYDDVDPHGILIALAALSHADCELNEAGIRAFEQWEDKRGILPLQKHMLRDTWLEKYRLQTIKFLEEV